MSCLFEDLRVKIQKKAFLCLLITSHIGPRIVEELRCSKPPARSQPEHHMHDIAETRKERDVTCTTTFSQIRTN
jgi:hypothetical protein